LIKVHIRYKGLPKASLGLFIISAIKNGVTSFLFVSFFFFLTYWSG
jgi:ABC-type multidrug transport system permease subunit